MPREYVTSRRYLPSEPGEEVRLQLTDAETKEIFETRARLAKRPEELTEPVKLVVRGGPHEDTQELWYAELLDSEEDAEVDRELLAACLDDVRDGSDVINARSDGLKTILSYLVENGEFENHSQAARRLLWRQLAEEYPHTVRVFETIKEEAEDGEIDRALRSRR